ncbi:MAG: type IV pili twitching motility protein PilT, partial [Gemmatimonadetes bacterium]|nr:type IV pili twitching motility protein PilT [Gemmatimonadota bacterium]
AVKENIRDSEKALAIPSLIKEGGVQYGMQSFDQSLMDWYRKDVISYDDAVFYSSNPSEFALKVSGIDSTSDRTFSDRLGDSGGVIE